MFICYCYFKYCASALVFVIIVVCCHCQHTSYVLWQQQQRKRRRRKTLLLTVFPFVYCKSNFLHENVRKRHHKLHETLTMFEKWTTTKNKNNEKLQTMRNEQQYKNTHRIMTKSIDIDSVCDNKWFLQLPFVFVLFEQVCRESIKQNESKIWPTKTNKHFS